MENKNQVEPLLYIDQPLLQKPVVFMQTDYKSTLKSQAELEQKEADNVTIDDTEVPFNARTMEEKVHYLLHLPKEMPLLKCEIRTKEKVYICKIVNEFDEEIEISMYGKPNMQLRKNEIEEINLLGF